MKTDSAIFFDRDGVLIKAPVVNGLPKSSQTIQEIILCDGIVDFCKFFKKRYKLIMITNQPDVERGINTKENILKINSFLKETLLLDDVYVCYSADDECYDRKPNPGMLEKAAKKHILNSNKSYFIGDRWRDIQAGKKFGCKTIFIDREYDEILNVEPDFKVKNIKEIFDIIDK